jgi:hypothetical protein
LAAQTLAKSRQPASAPVPIFIEFSPFLSN